MSTIILPRVRQKAYLAVLLPLVGVSTAGMLIAGFVSSRVGLSLLMGSIIWFIPQGVFAVKVFHQIEINPKKMIRQFYRSEIIKLVLVSILFFSAVNYIPANLLGLFGGYFLAQVIFYIVMFVVM